MHRYTRYILISLFLVFASSFLSAQLISKARILTTDDGLSDNVVNCFYKDSTGYMWIGTRNGLNRYDGHAFKVFRPAKNNSISNEFVNAIAGDNNGTIWVATMEGLNAYQPASNAWQSFTPTKTPKGIPSNLIWDLLYDKGLLWIASDVFEFSSYDPTKKKFTYYDWPAFVNTLPNLTEGKYNSIQKFARKSDHEFWLATTRGLVLLDITTKKFTLLGSGYYDTVLDIIYDPNEKKVFLSTVKGKCFMYEEKSNRYQELMPLPDSYPSSFLKIDEDNNMWLPAANGIYKIAKGSNILRLTGNISQLSGSLLPGTVNNIFIDSSNMKWVGTGNGIAIYDQHAPTSFLPLLEESDGTSENGMGGVVYDASSKSYFICATQAKTVFMITEQDGNIRPIRMDAKGNKFSNCNTLKIDKEKNIWLLTDKQVFRFDKSIRQFTQFPTPNRNADVGFRSFAQDAADDYWFGTVRDAFYYYKVKEKKFISLPMPFLPWSKKIAAICSDSINKTVWVSAYSSDVLRYNIATGTIDGFEDKPGLSNLNLVEDIILDNQGATWFATTAGGIFRFNPKSDTAHAFTHFDMKTGLPSNNYISLTSDSRSTIWMLSSNGLTSIDTSGVPIKEEPNNSSFHFASFASDSRSPHSIFFNQQRNEVLTAVGGGLLFSSTKTNTSSIPFNLVITSVRTASGDSMLVSEVPNFVKSLPYHNNSIQFEFAGLYYGQPDMITYEYRLHGYEPAWLVADKFIINYQNLPPGDYYFELRAKYRSGKLAGQTFTPVFHIVPPFWKTMLFILSVILIVTLFIGWLVWGLNQKLKAEKVINAVATSLYGQHTIEDICWDTAKNCVMFLGFTDCVVYVYDYEKKLLVQKAAFGPKNPWQREISNSLAIPPGQGIVGSVALSGIMEVIPDTRKDGRYIEDDEKRLSEIAVPLFVDGLVFGVIDSEHPKKNFYTRYHARLLKKIAAVCAERISKYEAEEKLRAKIARDLHDEMGSTLTSINIMSKVAMENDPAKGQVKEYLQKIKDNSSRILESIADMVWVINPANDNFERLMFRMKEFTAEMLEPLKISFHFHEEGVLHAIQLNLEQRKDIYMIFKEAITNAAKYSDCREIMIVLSERTGKLTMEIDDNGRGFDTSVIKSGNGLQNMKTRAAQIGAELIMQSTVGKGTKILLRLNLS